MQEADEVNTNNTVDTPILDIEEIVNTLTEEEEEEITDGFETIDID